MDTFNPLDHPICFQDPDRVHVPSAWYEHVPFAFYLTEVAQPKCLVELGTHNGVSFLAFCQAIQTLSLDTKSFAIDTWEGDEMAGYYGQEVFDELRAYHDSHYAKFSNLLRMTFDAGVDYFSDGSIDLLHIDGLHTYEAVKHDFENWLIKLSPNAIVIFHDTNVHENDFGVWKYWEELKQKYASFEFYHGHGLGVLTLAENFPRGLRVDKTGSILKKFRNFFAVLGQKHLFENGSKNLSHEIEVLRGQVGLIESNHEAAVLEAQHYRNSLISKEAEIESLKNAIAKHEEFASTSEAEMETLKNAIAKHEEFASTSEAEMETLKNAIAKYEARLQEINSHWEALVNSKTWRALNKLGKFNMFPDLRTATTSSLVETIPYETWVRLYDTLNDDMRTEINAEITTFSYRPLVSIVMPTYNSEEKWLRAAIESVLAQLYKNWELCIADDCSIDKNVRRVIKEYARKDDRIKYLFRNENGHISAASNSALSITSGEFVAFLDHDDLLAENALYRIIQALNQNSNYDVIFSDEDKTDENGRRFDPYFKPNWMPDLFNSQNCVTHLVVYRKKIIDAVGGFRVGYEGAQDWDLMMRISEIIPKEKILHVPYVLYHWRAIPGSTAKAKNEKSYIEKSQERTICDHFVRTKTPVEVTPHFNDLWRIKYLIDGDLPPVSIIIPTKNQVELLKRCVNSILDKTTYRNYEILIVDNSSDEQETLIYLHELVKTNLARVLNYPQAFNFSAINNFAVDNSNADVIVLLNNDTEVITPDWLTEMVSLAIRPFTGAVGAKLYYPDDTIQHAGVILGLGGVAGHAYWHQPRSTYGQMTRAMLTQNYSAVTGACLAVERRKFLEVGGLDEKNLKIAFNDIDFCLKLLKAGYLNVWTPFAEIYHHESVSRGYEDTPEKQERFSNEALYMMAKWRRLLQNDPAYNLNLTLERADFGLAFPPRTQLP